MPIIKGGYMVVQLQAHFQAHSMVRMKKSVFAYLIKTFIIKFVLNYLSISTFLLS